MTRTLWRFDTTHPVVEFDWIPKAKHLLSVLVYFGLHIMLKYKVGTRYSRATSW
jgi:hypothetical protein